MCITRWNSIIMSCEEKKEKVEYFVMFGLVC